MIKIIIFRLFYAAAVTNFESQSLIVNAFTKFIT